jgi:KTSC domain-containing protein
VVSPSVTAAGAWSMGLMRSAFTVGFLLLLATPAAHGAVGAAAGGGPAELESFDCVEVTRSRMIRRVCYDELSQNMIVDVGGTYRQFCGVERATAEAFLEARSMAQYFSRLRRSHPCPK